MSAANATRTIGIVTACMKCEGTPTFAFTEIEVTDDQAENGIHYYLAEAALLEQGFEEPFVHFDECDAPSFLFPAVKENLAFASVIQRLTHSEKP